VPQGCWHDLRNLLATTPVDRFHGVRNTLAGLEDTWVQPLLISLGATLAAVAAAVLIIHLLRRRQWLKLFSAQAAGSGLNEQERRLLAVLAEQAHLRDPSAIFTNPSVFDRGMEKLMLSSRFLSLSDAMQAMSIAVLNSLREKIGLQRMAQETIEPAQGRVIVPRGAKLTVVSRGHCSEFEATVSNSRPAQIMVEADSPVDCATGEGWLIRYTDGDALWEMDAAVVRNDQGRILLSHSGQARFINRRRYPRIPTRKSARVALFPLVRPEGGAEVDFRPATLLEIAGPGLKLESDLDVRSGQRVLVVLELGADSAVEGMGKVHRSYESDGRRLLIIELVGLGSEELAEMSRQTNLAELETKREPLARPREAMT
jgi:hypothetical protein